MKAGGTKESGVPIVEVSGKLSPPNKTEVYPTNLSFTEIVTGQRFEAAVANHHYSVQLPNHQSYQMSITLGIQASAVPAGVLVLNATARSYTLDIGG
jgi:hypothetical protein